jgi:hypothetical protein
MVQGHFILQSPQTSDERERREVLRNFTFKIKGSILSASNNEI